MDLYGNSGTENRETLEVDWQLFGELCRVLALRIAADYDPEIVVGIAKAGVIPGAVVAAMLDRDFAAMAVTRQGRGARPTLITEPPPSIGGRRVLVVDETSNSGQTLKLALSVMRKYAPSEVCSAVSIRTGPYSPDFVAMETGSAIVLPWERDVVLNGELVTRASYLARLGQGP
ncbi:MAG: phosphoribosyltransferase [Gemmatimonadales bacterium]